MVKRILVWGVVEPLIGREEDSLFDCKVRLQKRVKVVLHTGFSGAAIGLHLASVS